MSENETIHPTLDGRPVMIGDALMAPDPEDTWKSIVFRVANIQWDSSTYAGTEDPGWTVYDGMDYEHYVRDCQRVEVNEDEELPFSEWSGTRAPVDPGQVYTVKVGVGFLDALRRKAVRLGFEHPADMMRATVEAFVADEAEAPEGEIKTGSNGTVAAAWIRTADRDAAETIKRFGPDLVDAVLRSGTKQTLESRRQFEEEREGRTP